MFWQAGEFKQAPITPFPSTHWGLQHQPCRCDTHTHTQTAPCFSGYLHEISCPLMHVIAYQLKPISHVHIMIERDFRTSCFHLQL